jgi:ribonucrease Y
MAEIVGSPLFIGIVAFIGGFAALIVARSLINLSLKTQAKVEAESILEEARRKAKELEDSVKARVDDSTEQLKKRAEKDNKRIEQNSQKLEEKINERTAKFEEKFKEREALYNEHVKELDTFEGKVRAVEQRFNSRREVEKAHWDDFTRRLESKAELSIESLKKDLIARLLDEKRIETGKHLQTSETQDQVRAEENAKAVIESVLNRFARAYCPERGIGNVPLENENQKLKVLGPEQSHLKVVEKLVGIDMVFDENYQAVNVYGFDPVRRELGRATVEGLRREQQVNEQKIEQVYERCKKDLFQKILRDGEKIAKELNIDNLHPEVKNMMGALRYRYSFTQNQYFHCSEVGFLCGLLAAELDVPVKDARRAGLLHDIGKAMDHSQEGGHAVIGADFINQHGEADYIVHAVRAHHFDETPNTDLAYLVIAADAISGARPGARRSTAATYTQKVEGLNLIAQSFQHVTDTHVLSAGREIRVYVDGAAVNDQQALDMSRQMAHKIETDMTYPGQIKVTVVRQTQAIDFAR